MITPSKKYFHSNPQINVCVTGFYNLVKLAHKTNNHREGDNDGDGGNSHLSKSWKTDLNIHFRCLVQCLVYSRISILFQYEQKQMYRSEDLFIYLGPLFFFFFIIPFQYDLKRTAVVELSFLYWKWLIDNHSESLTLELFTGDAINYRLWLGCHQAE